jgi:ribosomal protein L9
MQFWRKSLIRRLTFYFLLFSLVPVSVVGSLAFWRARVALQQSVFDQLNLVVSSREEDLTQWITDQVGDVFVLARSAQVQNVLEVFENQEAFSAENQQEALFVVANHLSSILEADADYAEILVLTLDGQIIYSTNEATMTAVAESPQLLEAAQDLATSLADTRVVVAARAGDAGNLFGSVGATDVAAAIVKFTGIEIDKKIIDIDDPIKEIGLHTVMLRPHPEVEVPVILDVIPA